jgi:hypothetical protein
MAEANIVDTNSAPQDLSGRPADDGGNRGNKDNAEQQSEVTLVKDQAKEEQAKAFLELMKAEGAEKDKILAAHPELKALWDFISTQYKYNPSFSNSYAKNPELYNNLIAEDILEGKLDLYNPSKVESTQERLAYQQRTFRDSQVAALLDAEKALNLAAVREMQTQATNTSTPAASASNGAPAADAPIQARGEEKSNMTQSKAIFLDAVSLDKATAQPKYTPAERNEIMADHPELRGPLTQYTLVEQSLNTDKNLTGIEQRYLENKQKEMAQLYEPGHEKQLGMSNQLYDMNAHELLQQRSQQAQSQQRDNQLTMN